MVLWHIIYKIHQNNETVWSFFLIYFFFFLLQNYFRFFFSSFIQFKVFGIKWHYVECICLCMYACICLAFIRSFRFQLKFCGSCSWFVFCLALSIVGHCVISLSLFIQCFITVLNLFSIFFFWSSIAFHAVNLLRWQFPVAE